VFRVGQPTVGVQPTQGDSPTTVVEGYISLRLSSCQWGHALGIILCSSSAGTPVQPPPADVVLIMSSNGKSDGVISTKYKNPSQLTVCKAWVQQSNGVEARVKHMEERQPTSE
jgi:hypothetical protein